MSPKPDGKEPREDSGSQVSERKAVGEAHFREPARLQAGEALRGNLEEASRRPARTGESLLWNRAERRFPSLRAETGAALERELLLVDTPGEEAVHPRLRR